MIDKRIFVVAGVAVVAAGAIVAVNAFRSAPDQTHAAQTTDAANAVPPKPAPSAPRAALNRVRTGVARAAAVAAAREENQPPPTGAALSTIKVAGGKTVSANQPVSFRARQYARGALLLLAGAIS